MCVKGKNENKRTKKDVADVIERDYNDDMRQGVSKVNAGDRIK